MFYDSPSADYYEPREPRWMCMECATGVDGTLAELEDEELECPECGSTDIDTYSHYQRLLRG